VLDLGSGGGVPGLVLACAWPESDVVLLDGSERRVAFLRDAIADLGLDGRVRAVAQRAEEAGRSALRASRAFVTARGFAGPAVTAECGAALLERGGILAVSEPPGGDPARWPLEPLAAIGLEVVGTITEPATVEVLRLVAPYPTRYPRRTGIPAKRPLWK
jgi:16S rRNA (guanine527-N7)-methyltransferase